MTAVLHSAFVIVQFVVMTAVLHNAFVAICLLETVTGAVHVAHDSKRTVVIIIIIIIIIIIN